LLRNAGRGSNLSKTAEKQSITESIGMTEGCIGLWKQKLLYNVNKVNPLGRNEILQDVAVLINRLKCDELKFREKDSAIDTTNTTTKQS
jgi:hypothetical protein